jgi:hypothetical protein
MDVSKKLIDYLTVAPDGYDDYSADQCSRNILDYNINENSDPDDWQMSASDIDKLVRYVKDQGSYPVLGCLITGSDEGMSAWQFSQDGFHGCGGDGLAHMNPNYTTLIAQDGSVSAGSLSHSESSEVCVCKYLLGADVDTVRTILLNLLNHDFGGSPDYSGHMYIVDLGNGKSFYGSEYFIGGKDLTNPDFLNNLLELQEGDGGNVFDFPVVRELISCETDSESPGIVADKQSTDVVSEDLSRETDLESQGIIADKQSTDVVSEDLSGTSMKEAVRAVLEVRNNITIDDLYEDLTSKGHEFSLSKIKVLLFTNKNIFQNYGGKISLK